jgi:hypothetical protein
MTSHRVVLYRICTETEAETGGGNEIYAREYRNERKETKSRRGGVVRRTKWEPTVLLIKLKSKYGGWRMMFVEEERMSVDDKMCSCT